jgi:hypothetical protein
MAVFGSQRAILIHERGKGRRQWRANCYSTADILRV